MKTYIERCFFQKEKNTEITPNPLNMVHGGLRKPFLKNNTKKHHKLRKTQKMYNFGVPPEQGTNGERTNFWSLFRLRASLGNPWGTPRGQHGPKTSPKSFRYPPESQFAMVFEQLFMDFSLFFIDFGVHFL